MTGKFEKGQKVIIRPAGENPGSPRDASLEPYVGRNAQVTDFYRITFRDGKSVYLYTVQTEKDQKELVLHEDELEPCVA